MNRLLMSLFSAAFLMIALPCGAAMAEDAQPMKASRFGLPANFGNYHLDSARFMMYGSYQDDRSW